MRIKVFSSFCDSAECKRTFERIWGPGCITTDDDYTHAILLNTAMPVLRPDVPKENVIGLAYEPMPFLRLSPEFVAYAERYINKYYIGDISGVVVGAKELPVPPFVEKYSYMWHMRPLLHEPAKDPTFTKNIMSIMVSQKRYAPGHAYRHELVNRILQSNLPIDIYGRGCFYYEGNGRCDERLKGTFQEEEPYEKYWFHICIENFQSNHYLSEKVINPLLCGTTPVYLGCLNIEKYFKGNIVRLSGNVERDMALLAAIVERPKVFLRSIDREKVKRDMNLMNHLEEVFS